MPGWRFDLYHFGAGVSEQLGAICAGDAVG
jgi:hypothetical protein